ncbi:hypothetical protein ANN_08012 [Periplaneta americana]|uniref:RNA-directed DNA polymerase n=1 Tax=Periplaneta americana TaxID=6978 RepID=A0ABQ8T0W4_PERAM|nr:hypothetical protein ANN_08012 [Periplaneta americana]
MKGLLLLLLLICVDACPQGCRCTTFRLKCLRARVGKLLIGMGNKIRDLHVEHDHIPELSAALFSHAGLGNLRMLQLHDTNTTSITANAFSAIPRLHTLSITACPLLALPDGALHGLSTLSTIRFSSTILRTLPARMLEGLRVLHLDLSANLLLQLLPNWLGHPAVGACEHADAKLSLRRNYLRIIKPGTFSNACIYTVLDLSSNMLTVLQPHTFFGLSRLHTLDLRRNHISILAADIFAGMDRLQTFHLSSYIQVHLNRHGNYELHKSLGHVLEGLGYTQFKDMGSELPRHVVFGVMPHIFENNKIKFIEEGAFRNLSLLQRLDLSTHCIQNVTKNMFLGLSSLQALSLNQTCIWTLSPATFIGLPCLYHLDLSFNMMEQMLQGTFQGLLKLNTLDISFNKIHTIHPGSFSDIIQLRILNLMGNAIQILSNGFLEGLGNLRSLNLALNAIRIIAPETFGTVTRLQELDLSNNVLTKIPQNTFIAVGRLNKLDISNNNVIVEQRAFGKKQVMKTLGISATNWTLSALQTVQSNQIKITGLPAYLIPGQFAGFETQTLDLSDNFLPLLASNSFTGLSSLRVLVLRRNKLKVIQQEAFRSLWSLNRLTVAYNALEFLERGLFQGLIALEYLFLHNNKISNLTDGVFDSAKSLRRIVLSYNEIHYIHPHTFVHCALLETLELEFNSMLTLDDNFLHLPSLRVLKLSVCNITNIPVSTFRWTPKLSVLDVSYNKLKTIEADALRHLADLTELNLFGVTFECDCPLKDTWTWLQRHSVKLENIMVCRNLNSSQVLSMTELEDILSKLECSNLHSTMEYMPSVDLLEVFKNYIEPCVLSLILLCGIVSNGFLVFLFLWHPDLRAGPNAYSVSMTVGDLLSLVLNLPLSYWDILHGTWELGLTMCRIFMSFRDLTVGVSVFSVVALSVHRYRVVVRSFSKHRGMCGLPEHETVQLCILLVWGLALGFALPTFLTATVETRCYYAPYGVEYLQRTWTIQLFVYCILPVIVITALHLRMVQHMKESVRALPGVPQDTVQSRGRMRVANMVIVLTAVFCLSFVPNFLLRVLFIWSVLEHESVTIVVVSFISFCLFFCNSCFNPIALIYMSSAFRSKFKKYICGQKKEDTAPQVIMLQQRMQLERDLNTNGAEQQWKHWYCTFKNFVESTKANEEQKLLLLTNYIAPSVYEHINEVCTYSAAIAVLESLYVKPKSEVFARYQLFTRCQFQDGPTSAATKMMCYLCGREKHPRTQCPARNAICKKCAKMGHFANVCKSKFFKQSQDKTSASLLAASPSCLSKAVIQIKVNGSETDALVDTGSSQSFTSLEFASTHKFKILLAQGHVSMASTSLQSHVKGMCIVTLQLKDHTYNCISLLILKGLCADVIIGHDILRQHTSLNISFGGSKDPLSVCSLVTALVPPASLFNTLTSDCTPIAIKSRRHSNEDNEFIKREVEKLLSEGIIEESRSPWRAQVLITSSDNHKRRMVIDYSQTINRFTLLDAYPLPRLEDVVRKVSKYEIFSTIDLRSAYHQIPIMSKDKPYTAFEACGRLYQFCRIPFGVTNGVACFQRAIDAIIESQNLKDTFSYWDDVTICGRTQEEHDINLQRFLKAAEKFQLTLNENKSVFSTRRINLLGYTIGNKTIKPDVERLRPLLNLPQPSDSRTLRRAVGMFAHYSGWIPKFSEKVRPLVQCKAFPMTQDAALAFKSLKQVVADSIVTSIDEDSPITVETDASDFAIGATLSQSGRPVAFFSRTLSKTEQRHSAVEKEAYAIVEALRKWRHYLINRYFKLITDQKSVMFMFNNTRKNKIKNEKIKRWQLELSCYKYDIVYRPGRENAVADAFSRICSATEMPGDKLRTLHQALCHPGITRLYHWVRSKNLPYSLDDIKKVTASRNVCAELKPRFFRHNGKLIKATSPFERLNIDFKGPIPSTTRNRYILTVVDEYSRYPFAFPCSDMKSSTVIKCLQQLFSIFGMPSYIHSDRGTSLISYELKAFLASHGIASSRTTPYNPQGNGQAERYNGIIWKTILLALRGRKLEVSQWETVLLDALHSIRSLLCTATNQTPHERMFVHPRRSTYGFSLPTWLTTPGPVLLKHDFDNNKRCKRPKHKFRHDGSCSKLVKRSFDLLHACYSAAAATVKQM